MLYRPATADDEDADVVEALELARRDAELGLWFEEHCRTQTILRRRFEEIPVPAGLREQIISERRAWQTQRTRRAAVFAAVAVCGAVAFTGWWFFDSVESSDKTLTAFSRSMRKNVRTGTYAMDIETNDPSAIRAHFAAKQAPSDYTLPKPLEGVENVGCGVLRWQNQKVSMICFRTGRPSDLNEKSDMFLFVIDRNAVANAPDSSHPTFTQTNRMATATWVQQGKLYLLAAANGDAAFLKQYF